MFFGFCLDADRIRVLLGCYAACSGLLSTFWDSLSSLFQGSRSSLKMGPLGYPETSVRDCHYTLRNNPEGHGSQLKSCGKFRSASLSLDSQFLGTLYVKIVGLFLVKLVWLFLVLFRYIL